MKKIILADDEKELSSLIKIALEKKGYEVTLDPHTHLLNRFDHDLPDLILLDINLQGSDGGNLCTKIKTDSKTKHIPVILISGIMDLKPISELCGADGYLIKPFEISQLLELVQSFFLSRN
jgi:CheY-like chemotaxis protein